MFDNDTVIYTTGNIEECTQRLTEDLSTFKHWCNRNKLTLKVRKTKYTIFGLKLQTRHIQDQRHNMAMILYIIF